MTFSIQISENVKQWTFINCCLLALTQFMLLVSFYTPWKQKSEGLLMLSGGYKKRPVAWNGLIYDDDELFLWYDWQTRGVYFQPGPLLEILTITNLRYAANKIWTCAEPEFRLWWMKLCSSNNNYTTKPRGIGEIMEKISYFKFISNFKTTW